MVLPGGVGPQLVRPVGQRPPIREVPPRQHQPEILGKAAQKLVDEENVALLPPWADPQHLGEQFRRLPCAQGGHLLDKLHLLIVCELLRREKSGPQLCVGVSGQRRLHEVGHEVDGGHRQGCKHVVVPDELVVHAPQDELPFSHGEPGYDVVGPECGQLDVMIVDRWRRRHVVVLHVAVGCV